MATPVPRKERKRQLGELAAFLDTFLDGQGWMLPSGHARPLAPCMAPQASPDSTSIVVSPPFLPNSTSVSRRSPHMQICKQGEAGQHKRQLLARISVGVQHLAGVKPVVRAASSCSLPSLLARRVSHVRQTGG